MIHQNVREMPESNSGIRSNSKGFASFRKLLVGNDLPDVCVTMTRISDSKIDRQINMLSNSPQQELVKCFQQWYNPTGGWESR
jgi:hypothetical protein